MSYRVLEEILLEKSVNILDKDFQGVWLVTMVGGTCRDPVLTSLDYSLYLKSRHMGYINSTC